MKKHRTIRITERLLKSLGACRGGKQRAMAHKPQPVVISTDPNCNYDLACDIVDSVNDRGNSLRLCPSDLEWLWSTVQRRTGRMTTEDTKLMYNDRTDASGVVVLGSSYENPACIAQGLAMVADALLSKRGK